MDTNRAGRKRLLFMAWPPMVETLSAALIGTIVSYYLNAFSADAVAVSGSLSLIVSLTQTFYGMLYTGGSILLAPLVGADDMQKSGALIRDMLIGGLILSGVVAVAALPLTGPILHMMHLDPSLHALGREYLLVNICFGMFYMVWAILSTVFRCFGRMLHVMICNISVNLTTAVVTVCVYYFVPRTHQRFYMYALAAIISQIVGMLFLAQDLWKRKSLGSNLLVYIGKHQPIRDTLHTLRGIFAVGMPCILESILFVITQMISTSMIGLLGTRALLVKSYGGLLTNYMTLCYVGLNTALFVMVGRNLGEKAYGHLRQNVKNALVLGTGLTLVSGLLMLLIGRPVLSAFTKDSQILRWSLMIMALELVLSLLRAGLTLTVNTLKAMGEINVTLRVTISASVLQLALSWFFCFIAGWGIFGIWAGYIAEEIYRCALLLIAYLHRNSDEKLEACRRRIYSRL